MTRGGVPGAVRDPQQPSLSDPASWQLEVGEPEMNLFLAGRCKHHQAAPPLSLRAKPKSSWTRKMQRWGGLGQVSQRTRLQGSIHLAECSSSFWGPFQQEMFIQLGQLLDSPLRHSLKILFLGHTAKTGTWDRQPTGLQKGYM